MLIGIQPDKTGNESYSEKWSKVLKSRNHEVRNLDLYSHDWLDQVQDCDGVMWRWLHNPNHAQSAPHILRSIEKGLGIPVYPSNATCWHYDNKIAQYYYLSTLQVTMPETFIFWDEASAVKWANQCEYPVVAKLSKGASSSNVWMINNKEEAIKHISNMFRRGIIQLPRKRFPSHGAIRFIKGLLRQAIYSYNYLVFGTYPPLRNPHWMPEKNYVYFQELLPDNDFDIRVNIIGDKIFAYRRFNRDRDFRASGSGNFNTDPEMIDIDCLRIARDLSLKTGFQCMAYDFLYKTGEPVVTEVSYTFVDWMVHSCPGHWNIDLEWIPGQMWPEEAQVDLFIREIESRRCE